MARFMSLLLALSILVCYGGLYRYSFAADDAQEVNTPSGCHGVSRDGVDHKSPENGKENSSKVINGSNSPDGSCCMNVLTDSSPDLNARIEFVLRDRMQRQIIVQDRQYLDQLRDNSLREHDPPDLQISNSTFLL